VRPLAIRALALEAAIIVGLWILSRAFS